MVSTNVDKGSGMDALTKTQPLGKRREHLAIRWLQRGGNCKIQEMWLLSLISRSVIYLEIEFCNYLVWFIIYE